MKKAVLVFFLTISFSYAQQANLVPLSFQKDLIPEGIAIDPASEKVYLNSLRHNKIVRCNLDGSTAEVFVASNQHGYLPGFGMTILGDTLYALGNVLPKNGNKSIFLKLNHVSGRILDTYTIDNEKFIYLNDLAVDEQGTVYITDSESSDLYTINRKTNKLEVFFESEEIKHSNGIAISSDGRFLYLATYTTGIRILDIASKKLLNNSNDHKGIDGLKYHNGHLYAIVNGKRDTSQNGVFEYTLSKNEPKILGAERIWEFENPTDLPTTFAIHEDSIFLVSDSQLRNFEQDSNQIIDAAQLKKYQLVQIRL